MADPFATVYELSDRTKLPPEELPQDAELLLEAASDVIREHAPLVSQLTPVPPRVKLICLQMVTRFIENPSGVAREVIGNYSVDYGEAAQAMYLTEQEEAILARYRAPAVGSAPLTSPMLREGA